METQLSAERTLTEIDYLRLTRLLLQSEPGTSEAIQDLLDNSVLVGSPSVAPTVITMYTQVLLEHVPHAARYKITLCYPDDAEPSQGFISVLSPLGSSLIGLRAGDVAKWRTPGGEERAARIVDVLFQPEATGDYTT
ncbi:GreA/GreB family elongation factor [Ramlibacter tataouinensis]|uniref:Transcription elongation factor-like protein n=1 Tax=Ramlibacter tataouinensis (strain ATCC BAA-407 / DSM 14655 / LMG 21543 / TTB310) TaxID=365046 RepID=F5XWC0_RAMTT|nr:GreA/GreB family elongation factor [Ramlibacter tataouinensis]AEG91690.1 Transcription elongation factor-like protein [Ramlibacter tataouinensis TTB310]